MKIAFIFILALFSGIIRTEAGPVQNAINYPALSVQERIEDRHGEAVEASAHQDNNDGSDADLDEAKKLISQQFTVITGDEDTRYTIVSNDMLKVTYKDQGEATSGVYQVNGHGEIALPLVGNVKIAGLNRGDARALLNEKLMEYIREPQLTIDINTSGKYIVMGAAGPGVFPLVPDLNVMDAIIKAGFSMSRANLTNVRVMRGGGSGEKTQVLRLNLRKMMVNGDRSDNIPVKPNDLIYVPTTFLYETDAFINRLFGYIADYYTLGGNQILKSSATRGF